MITSGAHRLAIVTTAAAFGIDPDDILAFDRSKSIARARHAVCYVLRKRFDLSYPEIGEIMNRDHSTIMNSVQRADDLMMSNEAFEKATSHALDLVSV